MLARGGFFVFFTIIVPVDMAELLLVLLTVLNPSDSVTDSCSRFDFAVAGFPPAPFGRPGFGFTIAILANDAVAATVSAFTGGTLGFRGDAGRELKDFWGEPKVGRIGDCGRVREFADLGERTVDGFGGRREAASLATFVLFFGFGIGSS